MTASKTLMPLPFGSILGYAPGNVPVYSSDYDTVDTHELPNRHDFFHEVEGVYTGYKWQCVEFARRWLLLNMGYVFDDISMAYDIFRLTTVKRVSDNSTLPLRAFANGSLRHPEPGCMLIWSEGGEFNVTGHVAIITEVFPDRVRIAEQNLHHQLWQEGCNFSRELPAQIAVDGSFWIQCSFRDAAVLGWMIQTEDATHATTIPEADSRLFNIYLKEVAPIDNEKRIWLNMANPDEAAYVAKMKGSRLSSNDAAQYRYFTISRTAQQELKRASNELHRMFMHATDYVLHNEAVLEKFNIPKVLWPRLQESWDNRRNQMITGRFDFSLTQNGIKLYEYNCDSAACYMECGKIQGKWAEHFHCNEGDDPGETLQEQLTEAWRHSGVDGLLHIMIDHDEEELFHGLYMQEAIRDAGIRSKLIHGTEGLHWNDNDEVLDADGEKIAWVWKTWAWETALDQLRDELKEAVELSPQVKHQRPPKLMDVLLNPDTVVFEPLWTLIPSNKAILPLLWQMFPNYPYLLEAQFELTKELQQRGYASKPIVGRCGHNISIVDNTSATLNRTEGAFDQHNQVYQEFFPLPDIDGYKVQISTFSVAGIYAGAGVRTDKSLIVTGKSDLMPLRVVDDNAFLQDE